MLIFPSSPASGATFTGPNGQVWIWDGEKWAALGIGTVPEDTSVVPIGGRLRYISPTQIGYFPFNGDWMRVKVTAEQCPRIPAAFLAEERRALGERWYRQEYQCSFEDTIDGVFAYADIQAALSNEVKPLFGN